MRKRNTLVILSWVSLGLIFLAFMLAGFSLIRYSQMRANFPLDLTIGDIPVGGLNSTQAAERLIRAYGIPIEMVYGDSVIQVSPSSIGFSLNLETMLAAADLQRIRRGFWEDYWNYLWNSLPKPQPVPLSASISEERLRDYLVNEIVPRYDQMPKAPIPLEYAPQVFPTLVLAQMTLEATGAEMIWFPESDMCDGYALDIFEKKKVRKAEYDFEEDILASSRTMCKRYKGNLEHSQHLEKLSLRLFDAVRKYHGLGNREKLLLRISALLHDCGKFISMSSPGDCAYHVIMSTEILGLSREEQEMVANIVRYNTLDLPAYEDFDGRLSSQDYMTVMKLAAILRIANALDRSHMQKFAGMKTAVKGDTLEITTDYPGDITLEKYQVEIKAGFFEEVYGLKLSVRKKLKNKGM